MIENVLHPVVNRQTKVMVVGSMPGKQSLEKQQYYGNPRNHFWRIIGELFEEPVPNQYDERLAWLLEHQIGLWDSIATCEREGSLDANIHNEIPNDFHLFFETYPQIEAIVFNGGKAFDVFKKKIGLETLENRAYYKMPSTSPIPGKNVKSFEEKVQSWSTLTTYVG
ncbi:DNA-deoxyinosine glycosylase [Kurthia senegalensis]|uniref:DNA-deoxyinosine glycosylase n=1 Tax=Kurthia senegalensis TaxID=1033740 RepID=UPI000288B092